MLIHTRDVPAPPGGVYLDLDTECFRSMEDSLRGGWPPSSVGTIVVLLVVVVVVVGVGGWGVGGWGKGCSRRAAK